MPAAFANARLVLPDRTTAPTALALTPDGARIAGVGGAPAPGALDLGGLFLSAGMIDLHVHGGGGTDFMDGTADAFRTACRTHAAHGTTSLTPTSTAAPAGDLVRFLELCAELRGDPSTGADVLGGHLYGPYFLPAAKGCHPGGDFQSPDDGSAEAWLRFAGNGLTTLTVAPELPGAEALVRAARGRGLLVTCGHSYATLPQVEAAVGWGVRHVDHLFCAMSDRARLRAMGKSFPMPGGVMEATLLFDELTTEVIADGEHLSADLLRVALKVKGPDRLALVSDSMRAVDCPDGEYWFGKEGSGELIRRRGGVGVTLDGKGLASSVVALDDCVRTMLRDTGAPPHEVLRMATATPARILGLSDRGRLAVGLRADLVAWDAAWRVRGVWVGGREVTP